MEMILAWIYIECGSSADIHKGNVDLYENNDSITVVLLNYCQGYSYPKEYFNGWQVWGNLNPYLNDGGGSLAVDQRQPLNDCFLSKENSFWTKATTFQQQEAPKK